MPVKYHISFKRKIFLKNSGEGSPVPHIHKFTTDMHLYTVAFVLHVEWLEIAEMTFKVIQGH